ncbi:MAG: alpha amylase family protein [bacterium]
MGTKNAVGKWDWRRSLAAISSVATLALLLGGCLTPHRQQPGVSQTPITETARNSRYQRYRETPGVKYVTVWMDATANFERLSSRAKVRVILDKCVNVGVSGVAVEIRTLSGETMYPSKFAPQLLMWKGASHSKNHDLLQTVIEEAHKRDLDVFAVVSYVSQGNKVFQTGPIYKDHPEWATVCYDIDVTTSNPTPQIAPITQLQRGAVSPSIWEAFGNPLDQAMLRNDLNITREILQRYPEMDGFIADRVRFNGLNTDFSDSTRKEFEKFLGRKVENWPQDVFALEVKGKQAKRINGPLFKDWCRFRAGVTRDYLELIAATVKTRRPDLALGEMVGGEYPFYYEYGVNWASREYVPGKDWGADFWSDGYEQTGSAESLDFLTVGCFFPNLSAEDAETSGVAAWMSVEGGADLAREATKGKLPIFASIYAPDWSADPEKFSAAVSAALAHSDGLSVFDLSHLEENDLWGSLAHAISAHPRENK